MWLLNQTVFDRMQSAANAGQKPSETERLAFEADYRGYAGDLPRGMSVVGSNAAISITGILTNAPDLFARWFGGGNTVYSDIVQAAIIADNDPAITSIDFEIDSPGGQASAEWFAVMDVIAHMTTPTRAVVRDLAASAAYGIAAQAGSIVAVNNMVSVGSIGVVATFFTSERMVDVTSTNAPNKRPDPKTAEGVQVIRAQLDQIEEEFIGAVARGRDVTKEKVKEEFGRGAVFLAVQAKSRGMIDSIVSRASTTADAQASGDSKIGAINMDLDQLKADHPAVYAQAVAVGVDQGKSGEQARVAAHLTLGEASGAMDVSIADIKSGADLTPTVTANHTAATLATLKLAAASTDENLVAGAVDNIHGANTPSDDSPADHGALVCDALEAMLGIEGEANA